MQDNTETEAKLGETNNISISGITAEKGTILSILDRLIQPIIQSRTFSRDPREQSFSVNIVRDATRRYKREIYFPNKFIYTTAECAYIIQTA